MDISKVGGQAFHTKTAKTNIFQENKNILHVNRDKGAGNVEVNISKQGRALQRSGQVMLTINKPSLDGLNRAELKKGFDGDITVKDGLAELTEQAQHIEGQRDNLLQEIPAANDTVASMELQDEYLNRFLNGTVFSNRFTVDFSSIASKYADMRKEIESKYTGDELKKHLQGLDEGYDGIVKINAQQMEFVLNSQAFMFEARVQINNDLIKLGQNSGNIIKYDKEAFKETIKSLTKNMMDSILHYGELSKQYIIDGNAAPVTEEDKKNFNDYLTQNTDPNKGIYSLSHLETIHSIFTPHNPDAPDTTDTLSASLEKLQKAV